MKTQTSATCVQFRNDVTEYLEDALVRQDRESFELHRDWCGSCREFLSEMVDCIEDLGRLCVDDLTPERESELVALLHRDQQTDEESRRASGASLEEILQELMSHSPEQRVILVENSERFKSVELCQLALDRGFEMGAQNPNQSLELTSTAVVIAESLREGDFSSGLVGGLRAKAYAFKGNACRIGSDLVGASKALDRALELAAELSDPSAKATALAFQGSLYAELLNFPCASEALGRSIAIYRDVGDTLEAVRTSIVMANHITTSGKAESAVESLKEILVETDELGIPRLSLAVRHNLAFSLIACGRSQEAMEHFPTIKRLHKRLSNAVDLTRFKWLEGQIAVDSDRLIDAEEAFLEVKRFFVDKGMAHDVALVSLDLALVYLRQGRLGELKALASEMLTIFSSLKIHQETLAALAFCRKALEVETMTVAFVNELGTRLETARERARFGVGLSVAE